MSILSQRIKSHNININVESKKGEISAQNAIKLLFKAGIHVNKLTTKKEEAVIANFLRNILTENRKSAKNMEKSLVIISGENPHGENSHLSMSSLIQQVLEMSSFRPQKKKELYEKLMLRLKKKKLPTNKQIINLLRGIGPA